MTSMSFLYVATQWSASNSVEKQSHRNGKTRVLNSELKWQQPCVSEPLCVQSTSGRCHAFFCDHNPVWWVLSPVLHRQAPETPCRMGLWDAKGRAGSTRTIQQAHRSHRKLPGTALQADLALSGAGVGEAQGDPEETPQDRQWVG